MKSFDHSRNEQDAHIGGTLCPPARLTLPCERANTSTSIRIGVEGAHRSNTGEKEEGRRDEANKIATV